MNRICYSIGFQTISIFLFLIVSCSSKDEGTKCEMSHTDYGDGACRPVDPCAEDTSCVAENRECVNNKGVAECGECLESFRDYGAGQCKPADPCNPNPCSEEYKTKCNNDQGDPVCSCDDGYELKDEDSCVRYEYRCKIPFLGTASCGTNAERRACLGEYCNDWSLFHDCDSNQLCWSESSGAGCTTCEMGCSNGKCRECVKNSGPCCERGLIRPNTSVCESGTNYICSGAGCGDDVHRQEWNKYCDGINEKCTGETVFEVSEKEVDCVVSATCQVRQDDWPVCVTAPCCEEDGDYRGSDVLCDSWKEYLCLEFCGGENRLVREVEKYCSGTSAKCDGESTEPDWIPMPECGSGEACWQDNYGRPLCSTCGDSDICEIGSCVCAFEACVDGCCVEGEICRWNDKCGSGPAELTVSDSHEDDGFGNSVSISGEFAIVGAPREDGEMGNPEDPRDGPGAAYIFQLERGQWVEKQKMGASDAEKNDRFGSSVSISGEWAIVGAYDEDGLLGDPDHPGDGPGAAYIFRFVNGIWSEKQKLVGSDAHANEEFGCSVSINRDVAIVATGCINMRSTHPSNSYHPAYIFRLENGLWVEEQKLLSATSQRQHGGFESVSIDGDVAILGIGSIDNSEEDFPDRRDRGAAFIFQLENGVWVEKQKLTSPESQPFSYVDFYFGSQVAISGDTAIVASSSKSYFYKKVIWGWIEEQKFTHCDDSSMMCGARVSIGGDVAVVGSNYPHSYVFRYDNYEWIEKMILPPYKYVSTDGQSIIGGLNPLNESRSVTIH